MVVLENAKHMLQTVLDTIPVRIYWKDRNQNYLGCNLSCAKDAGLQSPKEMIGKNDFDLSWCEQATQYRRDDQLIMETGIEKINYEELQSRNFGAKLWRKISKIPLKDNKDQVYGILGCYEDITEQIHEKEKLQDSEQRLLLSLESAKIGTWEWNTNTQRLWASYETLKILGLNVKKN